MKIKHKTPYVAKGKIMSHWINIAFIFPDLSVQKISYSTRFNPSMKCEEAEKITSQFERFKGAQVLCSTKSNDKFDELINPFRVFNIYDWSITCLDKNGLQGCYLGI